MTIKYKNVNRLVNGIARIDDEKIEIDDELMGTLRALDFFLTEHVEKINGLIKSLTKGKDFKTQKEYVDLIENSKEYAKLMEQDIKLDLIDSIKFDEIKKMKAPITIFQPFYGTFILP